jgi:hypothetical protein
MNEMTLKTSVQHLTSTVASGIKVAVFAIMVLALSPLVGFWIVALVGAALFLLPVGATVSAMFPKAFRQAEDHFLSWPVALSQPRRRRHALLPHAG